MKRPTGILILAISLLSAGGLQAQHIITDRLFRDGLAFLENEEWSSAASSFQAVLADEAMVPFHGDALFWLVKTYIHEGDYPSAALGIDRYLDDFPDHPDFIEGLYLQGRILFLENNPQQAILALESFADDNANHPMASSAMYWIGEALMKLGHIEEARDVFQGILNTFPSSVKREATRYRLAEINLLLREQQLLDVLQWSHEEYLRNAEDFYRRENEYLEALDLLRSGMDDVQQESQELRNMGILLDAKSRLLALKESYLSDMRALLNE